MNVWSNLPSSLPIFDVVTLLCVCVCVCVCVSDLEEHMANHSNILVWRTPWTEEPGGLQPMGSQRIRHDWSNCLHMHVCVKFLLMSFDYILTDFFFFFFFATWGLKSSLYIPDISALLDVLLANTFLSGCYLPFSSSQKGVHRLVFNLIRSNKIFSLYG